VGEAKWRARTDPRPMLEFLRGKVNDRKLRLLAGAFGRAVRDSQRLLGPSTVAVAERYADGLARGSSSGLSGCTARSATACASRSCKTELARSIATSLRGGGGDRRAACGATESRRDAQMIGAVPEWGRRHARSTRGYTTAGRAPVPQSPKLPQDDADLVEGLDPRSAHPASRPA
jgi:hypothetical protein